MAEAKPVPREDRRKLPSIVDCFRNIRQLRRLKDLIRHDRRWAHQISSARPLERLGIPEKEPRRHVMLRSRINELLPVARHCAAESRINTVITCSEPQRGVYPREVKEVRYNIFANYDLLMAKDGPSAQFFDLTLDILDQLIGHYRELRTRKLISFLNPIRVLGHILGIPLRIIEYMGLESRGTTGEVVMGYVIKALMAIALATMSVKFSGQSQVVTKAIEFFKAHQ